MRDACEAICVTRRPDGRDQTTGGKRRNRHEHRSCEVFHLTERERRTLGPDWTDLIACVIRVTRRTWRKDMQDGSHDHAVEHALYVCSTRLDAKTAAQAIRDHWGIENRLHHVRDVSLDEDASRIRQKPTRFARFRTFALNILRANHVQNIKRELYRNALNLQRLLNYALA